MPRTKRAGQKLPKAAGIGAKVCKQSEQNGIQA